MLYCHQLRTQSPTPSALVLHPRLSIRTLIKIYILAIPIYVLISCYLYSDGNLSGAELNGAFATLFSSTYRPIQARCSRLQAGIHALETKFSTEIYPKRVRNLICYGIWNSELVAQPNPDGDSPLDHRYGQVKAINWISVIILRSYGAVEASYLWEILALVRFGV